MSNQPIGIAAEHASRRAALLAAAQAQGMSPQQILRNFGERPEAIPDGVPTPPRSTAAVMARKKDPIVHNVEGKGAYTHAGDIAPHAAQDLVDAVTAKYDEPDWPSGEKPPPMCWRKPSLREARIALGMLAREVFGARDAAIVRWLDCDARTVVADRREHARLMERGGGFADWYATIFEAAMRRWGRGEELPA